MSHQTLPRAARPRASRALRCLCVAALSLVPLLAAYDSGVSSSAAADDRMPRNSVICGLVGGRGAQRIACSIRAPFIIPAQPSSRHESIAWLRLAGPRWFE
jgi:hypothetical protein